jgi:hypothetical protein
VLTVRDRLSVRTTRTKRRELDVFLLKLQLILEGSRRHQRPFVLTRFGFARPTFTPAFVVESRERVRVCDAMGSHADAAIVAWDNTDRTAATIAADRLVRATRPDCDVHVTSVAFPDDGLTIPALLAALPDAEEIVYRRDGDTFPHTYDRPGYTPQPAHEERRRRPA